MRARNADGGLSEAAWQSQVFGFLRFYGWRFHHSPDNRPVVAGGGRAGRQHVGDRGFPDVTATRRLDGYGRELVIAELKAEKGRLGPGQQAWLDAFEEVARARDPRPQAPVLYVAVWRPSDREEVERVLCGPAGPGVMVARGVEPVRSQVD